MSLILRALLVGALIYGLTLFLQCGKTADQANRSDLTRVQLLRNDALPACIGGFAQRRRKALQLQYPPAGRDHDRVHASELGRRSTPQDRSPCIELRRIARSTRRICGRRSCGTSKLIGRSRRHSSTWSQRCPTHQGSCANSSMRARRETNVGRQPPASNVNG